jgi:hypothetical protein
VTYRRTVISDGFRLPSVRGHIPIIHGGPAVWLVPFGIYRPVNASAIVVDMKIRTAFAATAIAATVAATVATVAAAPSAAHAGSWEPTPVPATPGAWIHGVGNFVLDEPNTYGHRIRFSVLAWVNGNGTTRGVFGYRHLLPDGQVLGEGHAEVTCVNVRDDTAMVAAVVPQGQGNVVNHGFYLKIVDGGRHGDRIELAQAGGDPAHPAPRHCVDTAELGALRYPVEPGNYTFGS